MGIGALAAGQPPSPLGWGFALALASTWCDAVLFLSPPGQEALPWLSIVLAVLALVFVVRGLKQIFAAANRPSRKVWSSILVLVSLLLIGVSAFASFKSRAMPEAPQVGQKAPGFALMDTHDQPVSLAELFSSTLNDPPPKAVLLIF
jgi:energy-coupling factor transporter transmembrane protein EcfT